MKYEHDVIRDLMPLCIDGIASEKSQEAVNEHLAECPDCRKEWEQMTAKIKTYDSAPLPDDTPKYAETAKRVRKKHKWMLLKVTLCVLAAVYVLGLAGNYADGARFTPQSAAELFVKKDVQPSLYETPEEWHSAQKPEITYLGAVKSKDGKAVQTFMRIYQPDLDLTFWGENEAERSDPLRLGMWIGGNGSWNTDPIKENAILMLEGGGSYDNSLNMLYTVAFYVTDERVKTVTFKILDSEYSVEIGKNGFGAMRYDEYDNAKMTAPHLQPDYSVKEGTATDADGNVLYRVQPFTRHYGEQEWTGYEWVSTE